MQYNPTYYPQDTSLANELQRIAAVLNQVHENIAEPRYKPPDKLRNGMIRYADGIEWDPGSGEGLYVYINTSWVFLGGGTGATGIPQTDVEAGLGITPTNQAYVEGHLVRYGMDPDGSSGVAAAWDLADQVSNAGGNPILVPANSAGCRIAAGVSTRIGTSVVFFPGSYLLYTGAAEIAILTLGAVTGVAFAQVFENLDVRRQTQADFTNINNIGIRAINLDSCKLDWRLVDKCTIGVQCEGNDYGFANTRLFPGAVRDCKESIKVTNADTSLTSGYSNECSIYGGRLTVSTGVHPTIDRVGVHFTSERTAKNPPNSWKIHDVNFEQNNTGSGEALPVHVEYGYFNEILRGRDEGNDSFFMRCENDAEYNVATTTTNLLSAVDNQGDYDTNFVFPIRQLPFNRQVPTWTSKPLARVANEYDGAGKISVSGMSMRTSSNGFQWKELDSFVVAQDYLEVGASRGIGVLIPTKSNRRFVVRRDCEAANGGRIIVIPYDTNMTQLTTDGGYVRATAAATVSHTTGWGGAYQTGADSADPVWFSVLSSVFFVWVGIASGTAVARVRSLSIDSWDGEPIRPFQGFTDANGDPFPNDDRAYATEPPATSSLGITYPAGAFLRKYNAAKGDDLGFRCEVQGNPGTWETVAMPDGALTWMNL